MRIPKNGCLAQKRPKLAQNWHFWPNIGLFGPFDLMPNQKTMQTRCLSVFFPLRRYQNFCFLPYKLGFGAKKRQNLAQNKNFWSFSVKYWPFWSIWCSNWPIKQVGFWYVGTRTFAPKYAFFGKFGAHWLVVARGLYLARHLFTLSYISSRENDFPVVKSGFWGHISH